jgi:mono/diheme cytochrome c family protein
MWRAVTIGAALAVAVSGTALAQSRSGVERPGEQAGLPARGAAFAARECSGCHSITKDGISPRMDAPPFGEISGKYADYRLDWELETIASVGHYAMPPKAMTAIQINDVTAYIRSLADEPESRRRRP